MKKIKILILFFFCSLCVFSQDKVDGGEIKHYVSTSESFKNLIRVYLDSTYNRFGCTNTDKLSFIQRIGSDSIKNYYYYELLNIQNMPFHIDNYFKELKDMGNVVLTVDTINIFIREEVLKDLPFSDSINYLGKKDIILKYGGSFELCFPGGSDYLRFTFSSDGKPNIESYEYYMPIRSHKKTKKNKRKRCFNKKKNE